MAGATRTPGAGDALMIDDVASGFRFASISGSTSGFPATSGTGSAVEVTEKSMPPLCRELWCVAHTILPSQQSLGINRGMLRESGYRGIVAVYPFDNQPHT